MWGADRVERKEYQDYVSRLQLTSWTAEFSWFLSRLSWNDSCILRACKAWLDLTRPLRLTLLTSSHRGTKKRNYKRKRLCIREQLMQDGTSLRAGRWEHETCCSHGTVLHTFAPLDCNLDNLLQTFHQVISRRRLKSRQDRGSGHTETVLRSCLFGSNSSWILFCTGPTFDFAWKKSNAHQMVLKKSQEVEERHEIQNEAKRSKL